MLFRKFDNNRLIKQSIINRSVSSTPISLNSVKSIKKADIPIQYKISSINDKKQEQQQQNLELLNQLKSFINPLANTYLTFGGAGDLILLLAECYNDKNAQVIFFANDISVSFSTQFLNYFKIKSFIYPNIMGNPFANNIKSYLETNTKLMKSAHLVPTLDYGEWERNSEYYIEKITSHANWKNEIGTVKHIENKKILLVAPSGSVKSKTKQKYLEPEEHYNIVNHFIAKDWNVFTVGSTEDFIKYKKINNENHRWLLADKSIDSNFNETPHSFDTFLKLINSATKVISVDTWLKTYTAIAGIETNVILSRYYGKYMSYGSNSADYVFLNTKIWPNMNLCTIKDLLI